MYVKRMTIKTIQFLHFYPVVAVCLVSIYFNSDLFPLKRHSRTILMLQSEEVIYYSMQWPRGRLTLKNLILVNQMATMEKSYTSFALSVGWSTVMEWKLQNMCMPKSFKRDKVLAGCQCLLINVIYTHLKSRSDIYKKNISPMFHF